MMARPLTVIAMTPFAMDSEVPGTGANIWRPICCAGAPVPTMSGSSAESHANTFEYHCQCGAPIVADSRHRDVCAELVMAALPESGR